METGKGNIHINASAMVTSMHLIFPILFFKQVYGWCGFILGHLFVGAGGEIGSIVVGFFCDGNFSTQINPPS
jgi:hypothetical protein